MDAAEANDQERKHAKYRCDDQRSLGAHKQKL
jgi:hypothetical protein